MKQLEPEMYYSDNDLSKILNISLNQLRNILESKKVKPIKLLNRNVYFGKTINEHIIGKKKNFNQSLKQFNKIPKSLEHTDMCVSDIAHYADVTKATVLNRIIRDGNIQLLYIDNKNRKFYNAKAINERIDQINSSRENHFYPNLLDDNREYYITQITQNLKISRERFNELYVRKYGLQPIRTENIKGFNNKVIYDGRDINNISKELRKA